MLKRNRILGIYFYKYQLPIYCNLWHHYIFKSSSELINENVIGNIVFPKVPVYQRENRVKKIKELNVQEQNSNTVRFIIPHYFPVYAGKWQWIKNRSVYIYVPMLWNFQKTRSQRWKMYLSIVGRTTFAWKTCSCSFWSISSFSRWCSTWLKMKHIFCLFCFRGAVK